MQLNEGYFEQLGMEMAVSLWRDRPSWLANNKDHNIVEHAFLIGVIQYFKCKTMCEVGVSSGFTSAVLLSAAREFDENPLLYGIDFAEKVYSNKSKAVGSALLDSYQELSRFLNLNTSSTTLDVPEIITNQLDFAFIDGNHYHPWATLDFINLLPFLKKESIVCIHDVRLPRGWQQGGVYLYECSSMPKLRGFDEKRNTQTNIGMLRIDDDIDNIYTSIVKSLGLQWQTFPDKSVIEATINNILTHYKDPRSSIIIDALRNYDAHYSKNRDIIEKSIKLQARHYWDLNARVSKLEKLQKTKLMLVLKSIYSTYNSLKKRLSNRGL